MEALNLLRDCLAAQDLAAQARSDYVRLRQEYRERWNARLPQWAIDIRFNSLPVRNDCVMDDGWYSRQAQEMGVASNAAYAEATRLLEEMRMFLEQRKGAMLVNQQVPSQRGGAS